MATLQFFQASYQFAPAFEGYHSRQDGYDSHPMLPEQILLHTPLRPGVSNSVHTCAKARSSQRGCEWWVELHSAPLPDTYYAFEPNGNDTYLLVFHKPGKAKANHLPFSLYACLVEESFPKVSQLWPLVSDVQADNKALSASAVVATINQNG